MSNPQVRGTRVPSIINLLNPLIRRLIGAGMPFGPNVLLTVRGRTSGKPLTFPVALIEYDGRRFVQSPFGEVNWVRNLRAAGEAEITKGRSREQVTAVELEPEAAAPILRAALAPQLKTAMGRMSVGRYFHLPPDASFEDDVAEARHHPMFELKPASRSTTS
jgi:deazaflavin-dependent oxidoreductase (nitroreductase family)